MTKTLLLILEEFVFQLKRDRHTNTQDKNSKVLSRRQKEEPESNPVLRKPSKFMEERS